MKVPSTLMTAVKGLLLLGTILVIMHAINVSIIGPAPTLRRSSPAAIVVAPIRVTHEDDIWKNLFLDPFDMTGATSEAKFGPTSSRYRSLPRI